jgi:TRAP-type C4-dicarboxylate transport system permease large subunit
MSILALGLLFGGVTLAVMFTGMPISFALGGVAAVFMYFFMPPSSLDTVTQNVYEEMASITLLSIPLFILKGVAIGRSRAGRDLYGALHAWMIRIPGGLGIANVFACALFAAMAGSSPATCSAIGQAGIPEMRRRGYSPGFASGIIAAGGTLGILLPPSITMILYSVAAEVSLGRLFLAGVGPGVLLVVLFAGYAVWKFRREFRAAHTAFEATGVHSAYLDEGRAHAAAEGGDAAARAAVRDPADRRHGRPLRGLATPSETAGLGAVLALVLIASIYAMWRPRDLAPILAATLRNRRC